MNTPSFIKKIIPTILAIYIFISVIVQRFNLCKSVRFYLDIYYFSTCNFIAVSAICKPVPIIVGLVCDVKRQGLPILTRTQDVPFGEFALQHVLFRPGVF